MCHKFGFSCGSKNYEHFVDNTIAVLENEAVQLLLDFSFQTESKIEHNRSDIVVIEKINLEKRNGKERCLLRTEVRDIQSL